MIAYGPGKQSYWKLNENNQNRKQSDIERKFKICLTARSLTLVSMDHLSKKISDDL